MTTQNGPAAAPAGGGADPVLERLKGLHPKVIDLSLDRLHRLLAALDHPERRLPPVVHVAGTNGKGSTVAFLRAMLEAAGLRVHVYTSPHLVRFHERIRLAGRLIDDDRLAALLEECEIANGGAPITFFEVTTAAAFLAFAREPADVVLLETGLGGRLDATNVVERPAVTAITRISYDHRQFLGDTLAAIAGEKAGILKPGVPAVIAPQPAEEAWRTLAARAEAVGAPLVQWGVEPRGDGFVYESGRRRLELPMPGLLGAHQIGNAGVALAVLDQLPFAVGEEAVRRGLAGVEWPARLQRLTRGPLAEGLPVGWELWLDGGHNDSAGEALAVQAAAWEAAEPGRPLLLVYGMLASKEPREFLAPLAPHVQAMRTVAIPGEDASLPAEGTAAAARACGIPDTETAESVAAALAGLVERHAAAGRAPARVLICGSLYLAGTVLAENG
ncbi:folylpolyglutamate synthase/dihydrofolate synthase family protein [Azospirillum sp. SYSU D00513]|uniref:bifunctional folylpolyglutamate synthase/dihydrofolate synthase n=1 Tax=Azospirillum sp. SYSU D00513 TaxID=2812561 RepID=UPI001A95F823|nr:folylpolyglutamate synthase/dihydrofolate synthase family protein [Azospirillum sp. SYSU D00513]